MHNLLASGHYRSRRFSTQPAWDGSVQYEEGRGEAV